MDISDKANFTQARFQIMYKRLQTFVDSKYLLPDDVSNFVKEVQNSRPDLNPFTNQNNNSANQTITSLTTIDLSLASVKHQDLKKEIQKLYVKESPSRYISTATALITLEALNAKEANFDAQILLGRGPIAQSDEDGYSLICKTPDFAQALFALLNRNSIKCKLVETIPSDAIVLGKLTSILPNCRRIVIDQQDLANFTKFLRLFYNTNDKDLTGSPFNFKLTDSDISSTAKDMIKAGQARRQKNKVTLIPIPKKEQKSVIEAVFVTDITGSMKEQLKNSKTALKAIDTSIRQEVQGTNTEYRAAAIAYADYSDDQKEDSQKEDSSFTNRRSPYDSSSPFSNVDKRGEELEQSRKAAKIGREAWLDNKNKACQYTSFSPEVTKLTQFIETLTLLDGGDIPEAVELAFAAINDKLKWTVAEPGMTVIRNVFVVLDAPPHAALGEKDLLPKVDEIPSRIDWIEEVEKLRTQGVSYIHWFVTRQIKILMLLQLIWRGERAVFVIA